MAKKNRRILSQKRIRKTLSKNVYTVGVTAALVAIGSIAEAVRRSPRLRERGRDLKDNVMRRLHAGSPYTTQAEAQTTVSEPY